MTLAVLINPLFCDTIPVQLPDPETPRGPTIIHPPKHETFDLIGLTNTDPKGIVRSVDEYRLCPWGLYMARPTPGRDQFHYLESWLLPALGLRASIFHFNAGHERDQDYYLDVVGITVGESCWQTEDRYLDMVVRTGRGTDVVDVDELLEAHRYGLLSSEAAHATLCAAFSAVSSLAAHGHDLCRWLGEAGMELSWR